MVEKRNNCSLVAKQISLCFAKKRSLKVLQIANNFTTTKTPYKSTNYLSNVVATSIEGRT